VTRLTELIDWHTRTIRAAIKMYVQFRPTSSAPQQWDIWLQDRLARVTGMVEKASGE
jgi:hypothetical protein